MPIEFLTDEQVGKYGQFDGAPSRAQLERFFFLSDADRALIAAQGNHRVRRLHPRQFRLDPELRGALSCRRGDLQRVGRVDRQPGDQQADGQENSRCAGRRRARTCCFRFGPRCSMRSWPAPSGGGTRRLSPRPSHLRGRRIASPWSLPRFCSLSLQRVRAHIPAGVPRAEHDVQARLR